MPEMIAAAEAAGWTTAEAEVWEAVRLAAAKYLALTEAEPAHGMEREEICHAFHDIQCRLAIRPQIRRLDAALTEGDDGG